MAIVDINANIEQIKEAHQGNEVRDSIADGMSAMQKGINDNLNDSAFDSHLTDWFAAHPEESVPDGSVSKSKISPDYKIKECDPEMPGVFTTQISYVNRYTLKKGQIIDLCMAYKDSASYFEYSGNEIWDCYSASDTYKTANDKIKLSCSLFAQLVWAGVDPASLTTYTGAITKAFDWGYQFQFPVRAKAYGLLDSNGKYFDLIKPNEEDYTGSYSDNSHYTGNSGNYAGQSFESFAFAADMAQELCAMDCEIPFAEADIGDIIFFRSNSLTDGKSDLSESLAYRHISHCAIVIDKDYGTNKDLRICECFSTSGTPIANRSIGQSAAGDRVRMANLLNRVAMVARHPNIMLNKVGNVPATFTATVIPSK